LNEQVWRSTSVVNPSKILWWGDVVISLLLIRRAVRLSSWIDLSQPDGGRDKLGLTLRLLKFDSHDIDSDFFILPA
jgi:hypothetical protein